MEVFTSKPVNQDDTKVFVLPVQRPAIPPAQIAQNKDKALYPYVSGLTKEESDAHIDAGIMGPVLQATDAKTQSKQMEIVTTVLDEQPDMSQALASLEYQRDQNPLLKMFVSPATVAALKQSDNPLSRRAAQNKVGNVAIALELIEAKSTASKEGRYWFNIDVVEDFAEGIASDLPIVSSLNVEKRKELANRFVQTLDSAEGPDVVKKELETILDEAASQGIFNLGDNRFYLGDFLALVEEGSTGSEASVQEALGVFDTVAGLAGVLGDSARLMAYTRRGKDTVKALLKDAMVKDNPVTGHSNVATFGESLGTPTFIRPVERLPDESTAVLELNLETKAMQDAIAIRQASGQSIDDEAFEVFSKELSAKYIEKAEKAGQKRYIDAKVSMDKFDNVYLEETFGTAKGRAYTSELVADREAAKLGGVTVPSQDGLGFVIKKKSNLPTGLVWSGKTPNEVFDELRLYRTTDTEGLGSGVLTKYVYSPLSQTSDYNNALLKQGEAARARAVSELDKTYEPLVKAVGKDGVNAVNKVVLEIRDGAKADLRKWPTVTEFSKDFTVLNKRLPTKQEEELYVATVHRDNVDWFLKADIAFKREVNKGVEVFIQDKLELPGIRVSRGEYEAQGAKAWDVDTKKYVAVELLPPESQLIRLGEPTEFGGGLTDIIATKAPVSRALKHTDVMGFNPGGSRLYAPNKTNFILKQEQDVLLADGRTIQGRPSTILVAKTQDEVLKAQAEFNEVITALHAKVNPHGTKVGTTATPVKTGAMVTKENYHALLRGLEKDPEINALIARNSGWNPSAHSVSTLLEYVDETGLDLRKTVDWVGDGESIVKGDRLLGDVTFHEAMTAPGILKRGNVRRDKALVGYGGVPVPTVAPLEAMQKSYMGGIARSTTAAYETGATNGLLKALIRGVGDTPLVDADTLGSLRYLPPRQRLKALEGKIRTSTREGKKLELERKKILYRLEQQNYLDVFAMKAKDNLSNILYDKGWKETSAKIDAMSFEPVAAMRGITFDSYLGLFNPAQLWVQASQIFSIIALSDKMNGVKAVAAMPYVRKLLMNGHIDPITTFGQRMGPFIGMTPEQFTTMVVELQKSGRADVAASLADLGEDSAGKVIFRKIREKGRFFYNEGELAARITAHISSSLEYIKKVGPDADLTSVKARRFVTHNSDLLTHAMTSTSRTGIEQLPMMQFMSYSMRMGEYMINGLGRDFTNLAKGGSWSTKFGPISLKQKVRLLGTQLVLFGLTALPVVGPALDYYNYKYGTSLTENDYIKVRHGALDALINEMTGLETEVGRRLAWGEGMFQTISDLSTDSLAETLLGPSYSLTKDVWTATTKLIFNLKTGGTSFVVEDLVDIARSIKTVNLTHNAIMAFSYGEYITKTGKVITEGIDPAEAFAIAMDIPLTDVNGVWRNIDMLKKDKKYYQSQAKKITAVWQDLTWEYKHNGHNTGRADVLRKQLETIYAIESLDPYDIQQIERYVDKSSITLHEQVVVDILMTDRAAREQVME